MRSVLSEDEVQRLIEALGEESDVSPEVKAAGERFMEKVRSGYFDDYSPDRDSADNFFWRSVKQDGYPHEEAYYLCTVAVYQYRFLRVLAFSNDLHSVDSFDFRENIGECGFYGSDSEMGYYKEDSVVAWMPLPEEYEGE